ncbi:sulfite exporter TauE/SafE family protein [Coralliovum pocilloporae]|uniref:sulfite exporter TauE/SafE family protein n=1 Tax=Coralliovum pocilloporae TaxID=3066369 RepID=UPI0033073BAA
MDITVSEFSLLGGLLLGLASSLHCAGMCGGIASGLVFMFRPEDRLTRARVLLVSQFGRITSYMIAGGVLGYAGAELYGLFDQSLAYSVLQWAAAVTLIGIGLSVAGILPPLSGLDRLAAPIMARLMPRGSARPSSSAPFLAGMVWGLVPCAMVYGALFTAMLTGSATGGVLMMAGFGLGTLPAVTVSAFGVTSLTRINTRGLARMSIGLAIAGLGLGSVLLNTYMPQALCII